MSPHSSCKMAERGRKRYSADEVIELIFADEGSNDEDIDCGSDLDFIPESDNEGDIDINIAELIDRLEAEEKGEYHNITSYYSLIFTYKYLFLHKKNRHMV